MKNRLMISLFLLFLWSCAKTPQPEYKKTPDGVSVQFKQATLYLHARAENIIRVVYSPTDSLPVRKSLMIVKDNGKPVAWKLKKTDRSLSVVTSQVEARLNFKTRAVTFFDLKGNRLLSEAAKNGRILATTTVMGEMTHHVGQSFSLTEDEAIYGLGQFQDGIMNYRGHELEFMQQNTVAVVPFLLSSKNYGILWDNYSFSKFNDDENGASFWSEVGDAIDYYFVAGANPDEVIGGYRFLTGKAPMFGKWAYGYWQSKERYRRQDEIIDVVKEYRRRKIPLDNIVQDWTYWGDLGWNAIDFDRKRFPNPKAMLQKIHNYHTHYMISIWPNFAAKTDVFKEMDGKGFIFHRNDGNSRGLYDAFNEKARDLYWQWLNKNLFSIGVDGWWMDATEPEFSGKIPEEMATAAKQYGYSALGSWARYLNAFSLMSCKGVYEHQRRQTDQKRVYILTRSAYAGQQRYGAVTWSGDIVATWQVLRNQISAGLNFCMAGIPYWTTDIGAFIPNNPLGCKDEAYREIYVRWFQFGAFCPMFRSHGSGTPREVWRFGEPGYWAYDTLVKFDKLRYRLLPYIYSLAWKVTGENYTIMRGLPLDFGDDAKVRNIDNQYMFGPAFLVNPVVERMYFNNTFIGDVIPNENLLTADGKSNGLTVDFYNGQNFEKFAVQKIEPVIDFDWNDGSRPPEVNEHYFSIRFSGRILTGEGGEYTFTTTSNDGIRLWVDNQLVIDNWTDHGVTINMGKIKLKANTRYKIKMEYYQTLGGAVTKLAWIPPDKAHLVRNQEMPPTKTWPVYLPGSEKWYNFWTGESQTGGKTIDTPAPIDIIPLFVRAGSIVPLGPVLQYADEKPADPIELRIYTGADGKFVLYEDENDNYNYEKGVYAVIPVIWNEKSQTLTLGKRKGTFPGMLKKRTFKIIFVAPQHGAGMGTTKMPDKIVVYNGEELIVKKK